ncbi:23S rRNA (guanosine(2251)-2'-O)-methyltransferase RlmB [Fulvivirga lutea]|uniref:23S rRNA (Guanosine(2251)-2'-O)-methyltransferase RlmB n=1 Tax=Fulvivirga lutea TaxID=2810512 RepID=A0A974WIQ4_9BACT|nr:23S rRNA (guanosine(2251)-2'-O)-methyltransferase RlmB [Fulvivirga lutea]QSE98498.1 23S rRNA (guanosine(2251)-2'-O)-methyltransferase RlmB [Fulvivirga lutea]
MKHINKDNLVFGTRAILETIEAGKEIDKLLIQKGLSNDLIKELIKVAKSYGVPFSTVPIEKLNRVTRKNHQGAIAYISSIQYASLDNVINETYQKGKEPLLLMLDRVTDVRNFGAVARTAECAGVDAIIIPSRGGAAINADAMKTSAGALNYIPICREDNLKKTLDYLKQSGITIFACTEKATESIYSCDFNKPAAIIMGSEEDGISEEYLKLSDHQMFIPMSGNIDSLNVSVSAGIAVFEAVRQRSL